MGGWWWFRVGYLSALDDIERTGLIPKEELARMESLKRAERRIWDGEH
jgi:hypothetical protein